MLFLKHIVYLQIAWLGVKDLGSNEILDFLPYLLLHVEENTDFPSAMVECSTALVVKTGTLYS